MSSYYSKIIIESHKDSYVIFIDYDERANGEKTYRL